MGKVTPEFDGTRSDQRKHPLAWAWNGMETGAMGECKIGAKTQQWQDRMKDVEGRLIWLLRSSCGEIMLQTVFKPDSCDFMQCGVYTAIPTSQFIVSPSPTPVTITTENILYSIGN